MDSDRFTVRLAEGNEPGTQRVTFFLGASWIATFHICGETVGIAVMRRDLESEEPVLRPRVAAIVRAHQAFDHMLQRLANGQTVP